MTYVTWVKRIESDIGALKGDYREGYRHTISYAALRAGSQILDNALGTRLAEPVVDFADTVTRTQLTDKTVRDMRRLAHDFVP